MNPSASPSSSNRLNDAVALKASPWRLVFRIFRWTTYAAAIITLLMVFHAAPPPVIATSPQAAARVEQKVEAVEQAVASGQSATLRLDQTELNSYLVTHLDISPVCSGQPYAKSRSRRWPYLTSSHAIRHYRRASRAGAFVRPGRQSRTR